MTPILQVEGLSKCFRHPWTLRPLTVLEDIDFNIREGEIFGLIGPNGAGKTTAFKSILGLLKPTRGRVFFQGAPLTTASRRGIGFLPEQPYFYDHLTVEETLDFYGRLHGLPGPDRRRRMTEVLEQTQLGDKRRSPLRTLSKGALQRVGIGQAIINSPRFLILDEPMSGLDPAGRHHMRDLIRSLQQGGTTILFSSHILPDAEALCDRVGILVAARLREVVSIHGSTRPEAYQLTFAGVDEETRHRLAALAGQVPTREGSQWVLRVPDLGGIGEVLDIVRRQGGVIRGLIPVHMSLEERFLAHVGHVSSLD